MAVRRNGKNPGIIIMHIAYVLAILLLIIGLYFVYQQNKGMEKKLDMLSQTSSASNNLMIFIEGDGPSLGDKNAPITMVEFSDYQCPLCRVFYEDSFSKLKKDYIDTGIVRFVYRDFPLKSRHPDALNSALGGKCVRSLSKNDDAYFKYHNMVFEGQAAQGGGGTYGIPIESITQYAKSLGISETEFAECMAGQEALSQVDNDLNTGIDLDVDGTPTFFLNGRMVRGARPYEFFKYEIEKIKKSL